MPALFIVFLDQSSKFLVVQNISRYESISVINGFFNLVHIRNRGMAFGLMNRPDAGFSFYFLVAATFAAILLILFWVRRLEPDDWGMGLGLSLVLGGALGNLIDRIRLKEVIDFLDFFVGRYHWPAFNVADSAITVGTFFIALNLLFDKSQKDHLK